MHFLCLHGHGTSAAVFKTQTATIRYELGKHHTYDFVQGSHPAEMAPGLEAISNPNTQHYCYFQLDSPSDFINALDQLDKYMASEGPFDGVMAFSQGAGLAAMYIVRSHLDGKPPPFRCAVLLAPNHVYDPAAWLEQGVVQLFDVQAHGRPIKIPTALVYGEKDPWKDRSESVVGLCEENRVFVARHSGGHDVPGLVAKDSVPEAVKMIRRVIVMAGDTS
ncbi:hypothetical protein DM02DRAFT_696173 [Periconia macrospinosa]|uniref:Serine hydrolase domain-containing protein n=1 Tax=Periconia macrospinosa TaxID=97972 RepID=A0A2V1D5P6_9PLEO|nr:hypothetical protein DM02DRAFT_696173 [Periconia macrospinosa]